MNDALKNRGKKSARILWCDLLNQFECLGEAPSRIEYAKTLMAWTKKHIDEFIDTGHENELRILVNLNASEYPVGSWGEEPAEEIMMWKKVEPKDVANLANTIFHKIWDILTIRSSKICPNCFHPDMRLVESESNNEILYECSLCAIVLDRSGKKWDKKGRIQPIKSNRIRSCDLSLGKSTEVH